MYERKIKLLRGVIHRSVVWFSFEICSKNKHPYNLGCFTFSAPEIWSCFHDIWTAYAGDLSSLVQGTNVSSFGCKCIYFPNFYLTASVKSDVHVSFKRNKDILLSTFETDFMGYNNWSINFKDLQICLIFKWILSHSSKTNQFRICLITFIHDLLLLCWLVNSLI